MILFVVQVALAQPEQNKLLECAFVKNYLYPAKILLPKSDFQKWAVIACDQYTSDPEYWKDVESIVGDAPSTLNLVLPEIYLAETEQRIKSINKNMAEYLAEDKFNETDNAMIYVERELSVGGKRRGLVGVIDLETYDYKKGTDSLIRATEETVAERIPPRVKIRKDAPLEFPHVLLFIDDPEDKVLGGLEAKKADMKKAYDFDLMKNSGHIEGYLVDSKDFDTINSKLESLIKDGLLFAVGDGNHSLATAKECHNLNGTENSRYALVEVVNIHEKAIEFEPIYRVLFNVDSEELFASMKTYLTEYEANEGHTFEVLSQNNSFNISFKPISKLPVGTLQTFLDDYLKTHKEVEIDYIHGIEATKKLSEKPNTVGFIFDGMRKDELFDAVIVDGSLPRKTFSMGHADDKRFYIEGRKIK